MIKDGANSVLIFGTFGPSPDLVCGFFMVGNYYTPH
jgi:hypothetical protein